MKWNKKPQKKLNKTSKNHAVCFGMGNYSGTLAWLTDFPFYQKVPVANHFWARDGTLCLLCFFSGLWYHLVWTNVDLACTSTVFMSSHAHSTPHLSMCGLGIVFLNNSLLKGESSLLEINPLVILKRKEYYYNQIITHWIWNYICFSWMYTFSLKKHTATKNYLQWTYPVTINSRNSNVGFPLLGKSWS